MANITEELDNPQWAEGIYQLETTDPVLGGPNGIANRQAKELAARTQYLKKKQEEDKPGAASTTKAGIVQLSSATDSNSEELAATPKAVKAAYDKAVESAGKGLPVGAVIGFPRAITSQEGFLKADGSTFNQSAYPDLHRVLGSNKLPNLTRSDIGMTAYFPVADIPDGWIKYDEIAAKVTQSAYPELYRKLVAQYGSITAVPKADDRFIRNAAGGLTVGTQQGDAIRNIKGEYFYGYDADIDAATSKRVADTYNKANSALWMDISKKVLDDISWISWIQDKATGAVNFAPLMFDASRSVPTADEVRPKAFVMVLCIKAQNSLDDVVMWIKAFGKVTNAGALDASKLAEDLRQKAPINHTHTVADISGLSDAVKQQLATEMPHQAGSNGYTKLPNGLMRQWGHFSTSWTGEGPKKVVFPVAFPSECFNVQITAHTGGRQGVVNADFTLGVDNLTAAGFDIVVNAMPLQGSSAADFKGVYWIAIGK